ncbi:MAG: hypothetical protein LC640_13120 [Frankia sp.]|nr:hypothetical protein [Frankia sp.]
MSEWSHGRPTTSAARATAGRYRELAGLLPTRRRGAGHRIYGERELLAAACAAELEARYGVSPKTLGFALRAAADPEVAADVRLLGALAHGAAPTPIAALDFEAQKARRLLHLREERG